MPDVKRTIKFITSHSLADKPMPPEGFPLRNWIVDLWLLNENGEQVPANVFDKVVYTLHPSFDKPVQTIKEPPFRIAEEGWGEFDIKVKMTPVHTKGADIEVFHDLRFGDSPAEARHDITFKNPKPDLLALLRESGPVGDENGVRNRQAESAKKRGRKDRNVDMEKLADGLQKLGEDDLLQVVQMVHDNKTAETYTKNDVENGEFHVDLYTLPDNLVKMLWDFAASKVEL